MLERLARPWEGLWRGTASVVSAAYRPLGGPGKLLQDLLNGTWLGHPLHAVLVDVVVGGYTVVVVLDLVALLLGVEGLETATLIVLGLALLATLAALVTGLTDFKDTLIGDQRNVAGLHGLTNLIGGTLFAVAFWLRLGDGLDAARWLGFVAYIVISAGAYIGGHIVFKLGYMVDRNAYARGKRASEFTAVLPATSLPEGKPTKASLGATTLVLVRRGDLVHALKESCAHVGGPLSEGKLVDDTIVCPWHFSAFRLSDGAVRHGPATSRQPAYRARISGEQVEVQGPIES